MAAVQSVSERCKTGRVKPNLSVKFAPLRCAGTALKRSPLPLRYAAEFSPAYFCCLLAP